jgi:hypothetical protein
MAGELVSHLMLDAFVLSEIAIFVLLVNKFEL